MYSKTVKFNFVSVIILKKLFKIYILQVKNFIKYSWYGCLKYIIMSHGFVVRNSFRKIYFLLSIFLYTGCDKVVQDVLPPQPPVIPQASTEVFKQMYPNVATFIFKPLELLGNIQLKISE